eukprot:gene19324-25975_t
MPANGGEEIQLSGDRQAQVDQQQQARFAEQQPAPESAAEEILMAEVGEDQQELVADSPQVVIAEDQQALVPEDQRVPVANNHQALVAEDQQDLVAEDKQLPVREDHQVLVAEDQQVPVAEDQRVPVAENHQALVAEDQQALVAEDRHLPVPEGQQAPEADDQQEPSTKDQQDMVLAQTTAVEGQAGLGSSGHAAQQAVINELEGQAGLCTSGHAAQQAVINELEGQARLSASGNAAQQAVMNEIEDQAGLGTSGYAAQQAEITDIERTDHVSQQAPLDKRGQGQLGQGPVDPDQNTPVVGAEEVAPVSEEDPPVPGEESAKPGVQVRDPNQNTSVSGAEEVAPVSEEEPPAPGEEAGEHDKQCRHSKSDVVLCATHANTAPGTEALPTHVVLTDAVPTKALPTDAQQTDVLPTNAQSINMEPTNKQSITVQPTNEVPPSAQATVAQPTYAQPATAQTTDVLPPSAQPTYAQPTNKQANTVQPTNKQSTTVQPTDEVPPSAPGTLAQPTYAQPATGQTTNVLPPSAQPTNKQAITVQPTNVLPPSAQATLAKPTYEQPATVQPTNEVPPSAQATKRLPIYAVHTKELATDAQLTDGLPTNAQLMDVKPSNKPSTAVQPIKEPPTTDEDQVRGLPQAPLRPSQAAAGLVALVGIGSGGQDRGRPQVGSEDHTMGSPQAGSEEHIRGLPQAPSRPSQAAIGPADPVRSGSGGQVRGRHQAGSEEHAMGLPRAPTHPSLAAIGSAALHGSGGQVRGPPQAGSEEHAIGSAALHGSGGQVRGRPQAGSEDQVMGPTRPSQAATGSTALHGSGGSYVGGSLESTADEGSLEQELKAESARLHKGLQRGNHQLGLANLVVTEDLKVATRMHYERRITPEMRSRPAIAKAMMLWEGYLVRVRHQAGLLPWADVAEDEVADVAESATAAGSIKSTAASSLPDSTSEPLPGEDLPDDLLSAAELEFLCRTAVPVSMSEPSPSEDLPDDLLSTAEVEMYIRPSARRAAPLPSTTGPNSTAAHANSNPDARQAATPEHVRHPDKIRTPSGAPEAPPAPPMRPLAANTTPGAKSPMLAALVTPMSRNGASANSHIPSSAVFKGLHDVLTTPATCAPSRGGGAAAADAALTTPGTGAPNRGGGAAADAALTTPATGLHIRGGGGGAVTTPAADARSCVTPLGRCAPSSLPAANARGEGQPDACSPSPKVLFTTEATDMDLDDVADKVADRATSGSIPARVKLEEQDLGGLAADGDSCQVVNNPSSSHPLGASLVAHQLTIGNRPPAGTNNSSEVSVKHSPPPLGSKVNDTCDATSSVHAHDGHTFEALAASSVQALDAIVASPVQAHAHTHNGPTLEALAAPSVHALEALVASSAQAHAHVHDGHMSIGSATSGAGSATADLLAPAGHFSAASEVHVLTLDPEAGLLLAAGDTGDPLPGSVAPPLGEGGPSTEEQVPHSTHHVTARHVTARHVTAIQGPQKLSGGSAGMGQLLVGSDGSEEPCTPALVLNPLSAEAAAPWPAGLGPPSALVANPPSGEAAAAQPAGVSGDENGKKLGVTGDGAGGIQAGLSPLQLPQPRQPPQPPPSPQLFQPPHPQPPQPIQPAEPGAHADPFASDSQDPILACTQGGSQLELVLEDSQAVAPTRQDEVPSSLALRTTGGVASAPSFMFEGSLGTWTLSQQLQQQEPSLNPRRLEERLLQEGGLALRGGQTLGGGLALCGVADADEYVNDRDMLSSIDLTCSMVPASLPSCQGSPLQAVAGLGSEGQSQTQTDPEALPTGRGRGLLQPYNLAQQQVGSEGAIAGAGAGAGTRAGSGAGSEPHTSGQQQKVTTAPPLKQEEPLQSGVSLGRNATTLYQRPSRPPPPRVLEAATGRKRNYRDRKAAVLGTKGSKGEVKPPSRHPSPPPGGKGQLGTTSIRRAVTPPTFHLPSTLPGGKGQLGTTPERVAVTPPTSHLPPPFPGGKGQQGPTPKQVAVTPPTSHGPSPSAVHHVSAAQLQETNKANASASAKQGGAPTKNTEVKKVAEAARKVAEAAQKAAEVAQKVVGVKRGTLKLNKRRILVESSDESEGQVALPEAKGGLQRSSGRGARDVGEEGEEDEVGAEDERGGLAPGSEKLRGTDVSLDDIPLRQLALARRRPRPVGLQAAEGVKRQRQLSPGRARGEGGKHTSGTGGAPQPADPRRGESPHHVDVRRGDALRPLDTRRGEALHPVNARSGDAPRSGGLKRSDAPHPASGSERVDASGPVDARTPGGQDRGGAAHPAGPESSSAGESDYADHDSQPGDPHSEEGEEEEGEEADQGDLHSEEEEEEGEEAEPESEEGEEARRRGVGGEDVEYSPSQGGPGRKSAHGNGVGMVARSPPSNGKECKQYELRSSAEKARPGGGRSTKPLGCSKCRWSSGGCRTCRDAKHPAGGRVSGEGGRGKGAAAGGRRTLDFETEHDPVAGPAGARLRDGVAGQAGGSRKNATTAAATPSPQTTFTNLCSKSNNSRLSKPPCSSHPGVFHNLTFLVTGFVKKEDKANVVNLIIYHGGTLLDDIPAGASCRQGAGGAPPKVLGGRPRRSLASLTSPVKWRGGTCEASALPDVVIVETSDRRTCRSLSAISRGVAVLSARWLRDCIAVHRVIVPNTSGKGLHVLHSPNPDLRVHGIFQGMRVHMFGVKSFCGDFGGVMAHAGASLVDTLETGSGEAAVDLVVVNCAAKGAWEGSAQETASTPGRGKCEAVELNAKQKREIRDLERTARRLRIQLVRREWVVEVLLAGQLPIGFLAAVHRHPTPGAPSSSEPPTASTNPTSNRQTPSPTLSKRTAKAVDPQTCVPPTEVRKVQGGQPGSTPPAEESQDCPSHQEFSFGLRNQDLTKQKPPLPEENPSEVSRPQKRARVAGSKPSPASVAVARSDAEGQAPSEPTLGTRSLAKPSNLNLNLNSNQKHAHVAVRTPGGGGTEPPSKSPTPSPHAGLTTTPEADRQLPQPTDSPARAGGGTSPVGVGSAKQRQASISPPAHAASLQWLGDPIPPPLASAPAHRHFHSGFLMGSNSVVRQNDCVELVKQPGELSPRIVRIELLWKETGSDGHCHMLAQCRRFYRPEETIFGAVAPTPTADSGKPAHLFSSSHVEERLPLQCVVRKVRVVTAEQAASGVVDAGGDAEKGVVTFETIKLKSDCPSVTQSNLGAHYLPLGLGLPLPLGVDSIQLRNPSSGSWSLGLGLPLGFWVLPTDVTYRLLNSSPTDPCGTHSNLGALSLPLGLGLPLGLDSIQLRSPSSSSWPLGMGLPLCPWVLP